MAVEAVTQPLSTQKKPTVTRKLKRFMRDLNKAMDADGRTTLLEDMDPEQRKLKLQSEQKSKREFKLALGVTGVALGASYLPVLL